MENNQTPERLKYLQAMPLELKVKMTQARLREFSSQLGGSVYVSFSGGKDSTVLLDIARKIYPDIPAVFSNTGLEYPEIRKFAMSHENVEMVQPRMRFDEVISQYGYPLIGKEVAEAIYYARKIRSQDVQLERERERGARGRASDSDERFTQPQDNTDGCVPNLHTHTSGRTTKHHRTELNGTRSKNNAPPPQIMDTQEDGTQREPHGRRNSQPKSRGEWQDWRRGCL